MQSGYGVSEIPQFLVDGLCSPLFPSTTEQHPPPPHHHHQHTTSITTPTPSSFQIYHLQQQHHLQQQQQQQQQPHHQLQQFYHHHLQPPPPPPPPPPQPQQLEVSAAARFAHFHPIPITQQFFEQQHQQQQQTTTHQLHLFDQQRRGLHAHLGLDHDSPAPPTSASPAPPTSASPAPPPFMNFRLAVSGGGSRDGLNEDNGTLLPTDDEACESRMNLWTTPPQPTEEDTAIKEPFWRPLDIDYPKSNNKRCKEKETTVLEESSPKHFKETKELVVPESEDTTNSATNYKIFSELEAICKPGGTPAATATGVANNNNTTGSSSALTGDNPCVVAAPVAPNCTEFPADHASNASTGDEEGSLKKSHSTSSSKARRRRRRRQQLSSISSFFESLVKQLMDHQESLHRRFLEILQNRDHERERKEQQWREQEALKSADDARARAEQQAAAAAREAAIVSFLEKITGQHLNLPTRAQFEIVETKNNASTEGSDENRATATMNSNRWPKVEVLALINARSGLELRFQEPGLKGPLWEEVSSIMGTMGYRRSAKRCKEKWENINKYFRKTKESNKKRPHHSRTCPYFQQLDQLYSKSQNNDIPIDVDKRGSSELLDAIVVHTDHQTGARSDDPNFAQENDRRDLEDEDEAHEEGEEELEGGGAEEGEGETHGLLQWNQPPNPDEDEDEDEEEETHLSSHEQHPNLFFHALQSQ